ncbi:MAG: PH domain-containing protein [Patescibacteria group bacterium]
MLVSKLNLDPGEKIIFEVRRHWFVFWMQSTGIILGAFGPLLIWAVASDFLPAKIVQTFNANLAVVFFLYSLWLLLFWVLFFIKWTNYYLDVWYITEKRIIDVDQKSLFHREVSNLRFDKIQDISIEVNGIIPTFLDFGDIRVQTAAEDSRSFQIKNVAQPEKMRSVIFSHHNREGDKVTGPHKILWKSK